MQIVTNTVHPDEPAHGLFEGPVDGRWVQYVFVVRGNAIAKYVTDFGPAEDYADVTPMRMPSFGDDSVAQLQAFAEKNRHDDYWQKRRAELLEGSTLIQDHIRQIEIDQQVIHNRSVFGPAIAVQRGGYSHTRAMRKLMEQSDKFHGVGVWNRMRGS